MTDRYKTCKDCRTTIPLSLLKVSNLYAIFCGCYGSPNVKNWMCELCTFSTRRKVKFPCPGNVKYRAEFPVHLLLKYRKFSPILYISWTRKFHIFSSVPKSGHLLCLKLCIIGLAKCCIMNGFVNCFKIKPL